MRAPVSWGFLIRAAAIEEIEGHTFWSVYKPEAAGVVRGCKVFGWHVASFSLVVCSYESNC